MSLRVRKEIFIPFCFHIVPKYVILLKDGGVNLQMRYVIIFFCVYITMLC
jgi:hypothetical protein